MTEEIFYEVYAKNRSTGAVETDIKSKSEVIAFVDKKREEGFDVNFNRYIEKR